LAIDEFEKMEIFLYNPFFPSSRFVSYSMSEDSSEEIENGLRVCRDRMIEHLNVEQSSIEKMNAIIFGFTI